MLRNMNVPASVYAFLALGIVVISQSGNIIRLSNAHPVAIAAWRLGLAGLLLLLWYGRRLGELKKLTRREVLLLLLSGVFLAFHFFTWIAAVQHTTVANAAIFFSANPVLVAAASWWFFREKPDLRLILAIVLGLAGVLVIGRNDFSLAPQQLAGDAWALVCALLFTGYFLLGKRLRRVLSTGVYITVIYLTAAGVSFMGFPLLGLSWLDYEARDWLAFALLALGPTLIGHTSFNHALRYVRAGWLSALTLTEPIFAAAVAWLAWSEKVAAAAAAGYLLICASVLLLVTGRSSSD